MPLNSFARRVRKNVVFKTALPSRHNPSPNRPLNERTL